MENVKNEKKRKFNVTGIENFDVIPLQKGKEYIILEVSKDGFKWKAKDSRGRVGWIPAHYCRALDPEQFPVPGHVKKVDHKQIIMTMQDPNIKSAAEDLLSFLDDPDTYMPHEPSKPKEDYSKQMFKVVEPGKGRGMTMREQKIEEPKPVVVETKQNETAQTKKPVEKKPVEKKPIVKKADINDLSVDHFPEPVKRDNSKGKGKTNTVEPKKNITGKADSGIDVQYGKGVDLSHVDMSNKGSKLSYEQPRK